MAIQNRRGAFSNFDPSKMLPGEFAIVQSGDTSTSDGKSVYIAFQSGQVKKLATYTDIQDAVESATDELIEEVTQGLEEDVQRAEEAARTLTIDNTLTQSGQAADAKKTGDEITALKNDLANNIREIFGVTNKSDIDGEITFPLAYGYWAIESDVLKWKPSNNKLYLASVNPIKVDAGDVIHLKSSLNTCFFAHYSADGSTWSSLVNTTSRDKEITTDGYVLVSVRNEPSSSAWTDADIETFFANRISIVKKEYTNRAISRIDNIDGLTGLLANESGVVQIYVTASETTLQANVYSGIEIPAVTGETIRIKAALSVTHPEYYGSIQLSVRERYNNGTVKRTDYSDLTNIIDYIVTNAYTASIQFVFMLSKASASSVTTGYYENIKYSLAAIKKQESIDSVLTESGDTWEV